ncbi:unnamed protein product [Meloidogyne enterolobii]|uniref:Uncharacterized protein n=1 Tax=Meloidogyne enterolobii TaxID=390850 RepID=A0ACB0YBE8_MELEN
MEVEQGTLIDVLNENGCYEIESFEKNRIEGIIEQIKGIINFWKNNSILLIGGSYLFEGYSQKSDIDCVILIPYNPKIINWETIIFQEFFGQSECNMETRKCEGWSLYCIFCWDSSTESLLKIKSNVFLIKLFFSGLEFDLNIVTLPWNEEMNNLVPKYGHLNINIIDNIIERFLKEIGVNRLMANKWADRRKGMLLVLSGYRANVQIINLLGHSTNIFRLVLMTLKFWFQNHSIYGGKFGFINGTTLAILICNIILKNPHNNSIIKIFKEFMEIYSQINFPQINLNKTIIKQKWITEFDEKIIWNSEKEISDRKEHFKLNLNPDMEKHTKIIWAVITPSFPEQNAAFNINQSTATIIRHELIEGREGFFWGNIKNNLLNLLNFKI